MSPDHITFGVTDQCTAACTNCSGGFNQNGKNHLSAKQMCDRIDEALNLGWDLQYLCFTGAEALVRKNDILCVMDHAHKKGIYRASIMTNGWWGYHIGNARSLAGELKNAGIDSVHFSTGVDHQKFVKEETIINAVLACEEAGIYTTIVVESETEQTVYNRLKKNQNLEKIEIDEINWIAWKDGITRVNTHKFIPVLTHEAGCHSLWETCFIDVKNHIMPCCGHFSNQMPMLQLGENLVNWLDRNWLLIWLAVDGPYLIWSFLQDLNNEPKYPVHRCDACFRIQTNASLYLMAEIMWPMHRDSVMYRFEYIKSLLLTTRNLKKEGKL